MAGIHQPDAGEERQTPTSSQPSLATAEKMGGGKLTHPHNPVHSPLAPRGGWQGGEGSWGGREDGGGSLAVIPSCKMGEEESPPSKAV